MLKKPLYITNSSSSSMVLVRAIDTTVVLRNLVDSIRDYARDFADDNLPGEDYLKLLEELREKVDSMIEDYEENRNEVMML